MRKIPLGSSSFSEILSDPNLFYVDKTDFIAEFLQESAKISLITRPRRFGKTLNLSMLRYFFDQKNAGENRKLFENLKIWQNQEAMSQQGSRPVIALTFKDCKATNWQELEGLVQEHLIHLASEHLTGFENETNAALDSVRSIVRREGTYSQFVTLLTNLSRIYADFGTRPLILIDEYDVPLQEAWQHDYWKEAISFFRNFFSAAFKDNPHIWRGVLTGCLRISRESMFTGLNNLKVYSVSSQGYSSHFGFTQEETVKALEEFGLSDHLADVENWYNGYRFGETTIYNPWSISCFLDNKKLQPYWANTSGNDLVKEILGRAEAEVKRELEDLMEGERVTVPLQEQAIFRGIENSSANLWNFLYFTGYLKAEEIELPPKVPKARMHLKIPNEEVFQIFEDSVQHWFEQTGSLSTLQNLKKALLRGDEEEFFLIFQKLCSDSLSYFDVKGDEPEKFYHGVVLGLIVSFSDTWQIRSNRESGFGRCDILMIPKNPDHFGIVMELKTHHSGLESDLKATAQRAMDQIEKRQYGRELSAQGATKILKMGIGFSGKSLELLSQKVSDQRQTG